MKIGFYDCGGRSAVVIGDCGAKEGSLLSAKTSDGASEKHLPVVTRNGGTVTVKSGSVEHPSTQEHFIGIIALETSAGVQVREIKPEQKPEAIFALCECEVPVAAYAYCNLHGLWKTEIN